MDLAAADLGAIHRPIGDGKKAGEVVAVARKERLADARRHHAVEFANRSDPELLFDTLDHGGNGRGLSRLRQNDNEFVTPQACNEIRGAHCSVQPRGRYLENTIASIVAEPVVHFLKAIKIDIKELHVPVGALGAGKSQHQPFAQVGRFGRPVRASCMALSRRSQPLRQG